MYQDLDGVVCAQTASTVSKGSPDRSKIAPGYWLIFFRLPTPVTPDLAHKWGGGEFEWGVTLHHVLEQSKAHELEGM